MTQPQPGNFKKPFISQAWKLWGGFISLSFFLMLSLLHLGSLSRIQAGRNYWISLYLQWFMKNFKNYFQTCQMPLRSSIFPSHPSYIKRKEQTTRSCLSISENQLFFQKISACNIGRHLLYNQSKGCAHVYNCMICDHICVCTFEIVPIKL